MARTTLHPAHDGKDRVNYIIKLSKQERRARLALALHGITLLPNDDSYGYRYKVEGVAHSAGVHYTAASYQHTLTALRKGYLPL